MPLPTDLGGGHIPQRDHGTVLPAAGIGVKGHALTAQDPHQGLPVELGQVSDGVHPVLLQGPGGGPAHKDEIGDGEGPEHGTEILGRDDRGGIRLPVVAPHFGEDLVEGDPRREGESGLPADHGPDLVGNRLSVAAEEVEGARQVQPALVDAEGLH